MKTLERSKRYRSQREPMKVPGYLVLSLDISGAGGDRRLLQVSQSRQTRQSKLWEAAAELITTPNLSYLSEISASIN